MNEEDLAAFLTEKPGVVETLFGKFPERIHRFKYIVFLGPFDDSEVNRAYLENGHCLTPETPKAPRYCDGNYYCLIDRRLIPTHRKAIMRTFKNFMKKHEIP
jgi:hypothetical protein